jgi:molecular chaperone GrpE
MPQDNSKEQEYLEGWKRARADLENIQKRMGEQLMQNRMSSKRGAVESLLPLADNFRSLIDHAPKGDDPWVQGVLHVARQIDQVLEEMGVEIIHKKNILFDPKIHEAVEEIEGEENKKGEVAEIVQAGYKMGETTIRPAKVKVIK